VRLRRKVTIAFFGVSALVSVLLALFLYRFIERQLAEELRNRLMDMASMGAAEVELEPYARLRGQLTEMDDAHAKLVEATPDYRELSDHLRMLRRAEPALVHYVYLLAPTADANHPRFVVDADVLDFDGLEAQHKPLPKGESISHFAQDYDVSKIPLLEKAVATCTPQLEPEFVYDEEFHVRSVSAYVPLTDDQGHILRAADGSCLGVLGVDITDKKMRVALDHAGLLALKIALGVIALALLFAIGVGTLLTRPVVALSHSVKRFTEKDFSARTPVTTRDEVGQLGHAFNAMAETIQQHHEHLEDLVKLRTKELQEEKALSERLLLNVLPAPIADRLKSGAEVIVDRFDAVTVLFADIVGFTKLSSTTSPEKLVTMLDEVFSGFDRLAETHGLEKIKTIGDAYMVVAGLPEPIADHATAIAHMAMDMLATIEAYSAKHQTDLSIRIGVHTGPVVAGVIGKKKFIYDLWGDTVNTASRMESHGVPGRVHISTVTAELIKGMFDLEARGPVDIKGKGIMETFLIVGARPHERLSMR
jgi:class 3 adenylate cyclase/HAMP domain-containing protein